MNDDTARPRLARGVRLQADPARSGHVLLAPERVVAANASAVAIIGLCDGARTEWMREPCSGCARREVDFGGCRCQAFTATGDARNIDPVCSLSPHRTLVETALDDPPQPFRYRRSA